MEPNSKQKTSTGNVFSLIFLCITSLGSAYQPEGWANATILNHFLAFLSIIAGFNILFALD